MAQRAFGQVVSPRRRAAAGPGCYHRSMSGGKAHQVDVAILGGGLAGNLLALQLRKYAPNISVAMFERSNERGYKVGESTVEVATNYLIRRMGLSTYIYKEHLPKNGLRFFFDSPQRDTSLFDMSEIGVDALPPYPSFQLDRARFERDLIEMNREAGTHVVLPASVSALKLSQDGGDHTFMVESLANGEGADSGQWRARWVVDTTGRPGMIQKARDLRVAEPRHHLAASWARLNNVRDMDASPAPSDPEADAKFQAWHAEARWTSRALSTNHFCYDGYWIWFIPLREGITSVGIVSERDRWDRSRARADGFFDFLREHEAPASLVEDAELIDIGAYNQLAFRTKRFFDGRERWAVIGDSSAFTDPFYSPGSDFIALANDFIADVIQREYAGETGAQTAERADTYDAFMQYRFDTTMAIYEGLYTTFGSYELFKCKAFFDTGLYYNLIFDPYARDAHLDIRWVRGELRRKSWGLQTMEGYRALFIRAADELRKRGTYHRGNTGHRALDGRSTFGVLEPVGIPRKRREVNARSEEIFDQTTKAIGALFDGDLGFLDDLMSGGDRTLYDAWSQLAPGAPAAAAPAADGAAE